MPKRTDIKTILIIGSGPIVIGQGCEFDYSGTQACKALREEGYQVVLVNSNPATIMTDPEFADRTYIEPITPEAVAKIIEKEHGGAYHIDALLPTLGGQTALNCACKLYDQGVLEKFGIEMIGANRDVIYRAEDRLQFDDVIMSIGLRTARHGIATTMDQAWGVLDEVNLPAIIRPAFTLGGTGGGIAYNREEFEDIVRRGLDASMTNQVLIDQSLIGWKEYELEVMRDHDDNVVIICSIENIDPMGVHTGDSITVAPAQTLTDREYQRMRDASVAIIRAIGVETGGSNIQFAIDPDTGDMVVIEMNPRVSRSSALASKATGFPIAKIAAKLAVGYTLWELPNDITGKTVACFEPTIDYVVTKIPRWTFEKFPEADETLTTQMKSVGEGMSIGRTFKESFQKGIRSMEIKRFGLGLDHQDKWLAALKATRDWVRAEHPSALEAVQKIAGGCTTLQAAALLLHDAATRAMLNEKQQKQLDIAIEGLAAGHGSVIRAAIESGSGSAEQMIDVEWPIAGEKLDRKLSVPSQGRMYYVRYAMKMGRTIEQIHEATNIDPWFLDQCRQLVDFERTLLGYERFEDMPREVLFKAKQFGYSDAQLACLYMGRINTENILAVRAHRKALGITPVYKLVDTCAAEFEAATPYYYSTYETPYVTAATERTSDRATATASDPSVAGSLGPSVTRADDEIRVSDKPKVMILGGGPNRIGQGIEFDYCCVQASFAADELGYESVMVNSNPETVSTDYDTSDLLFFEPLTLEDVLNIHDRLNGAATERPSDRATEQPIADRSPSARLPDSSVAGSLGRSVAASLVHGVIVQFGGQTPLNLARGLETAGVKIIGTSVDSIDLAEDRERFQQMLQKLNIRQPDNGIAYSLDEAVKIAERIGYPVLVRPSYVLGGRGMETCFGEEQLVYYMRSAVNVSELADAPVLIDKFLSEAIEVDVDVVADFGEATERSSDRATEGGQAIVAGVMEHIEEAGVHSGDSACAIPPHSLPDEVVERIKTQSRRMAEELKVRGLMNVQYAVKRPSDQTTEGPEKASVARSPGRSVADGYEIFVLEVNPRASRTVPFVSKATGASWARVAAKVMIGHQLDDLGVTEPPRTAHTSVKESVFPFSKFPGVDVILGPEMRSTGEVMGIDPGFPMAFAKSQMAAGTMLPTSGRVFLSVRDSDKQAIVECARQLVDLGIELLTTGGTHHYLAERGITTTHVKKISEGRPNAVDLIKNKEVALIINTPVRKGFKTDEGLLRATAVRFNVPMITTTTGAAAGVRAIAALKAGQWDVAALQDYFPATVEATTP